MASSANQALSKLVYKGERCFFNMETDSWMTWVFNHLQNATPAYVLNKNQKSSRFKIGLKEPNTIKYHIESKIKWDSLPQPKTFDDFITSYAKMHDKFVSQRPFLLRINSLF